MQTTTNLGLKKPESTDTVNIADLNYNADKLDTEVLKAQQISDRARGLIYLEPTVASTGVWTATSSDITAYYDGLMVVIKCPANSSSGLTLNINGLGAKTVVFNVTSAISTRYSADSIIIATYKTIDGTSYWSIMDYDANTNTQVRQYQTTSNVDYPILTRYNTTDKTGTYEQAYSRFAPDVTVNPSTGEVKATKFVQDGSELSVMHSATISVPAAGGTVTVTGMTATAVVWVAPAPSSTEVWAESGCRCTAQGTDSLTFTVDTTASTTIDMNVAWM